jgi:hypothetical protein
MDEANGPKRDDGGRTGNLVSPRGNSIDTNPLACATWFLYSGYVTWILRPASFKLLQGTAKIDSSSKYPRPLTIKSQGPIALGYKAYNARHNYGCD